MLSSVLLVHKFLRHLPGGLESRRPKISGEHADEISMARTISVPCTVELLSESWVCGLASATILSRNRDNLQYESQMHEHHLAGKRHIFKKLR